jgi:hypothetical protein
LESDPGRWFDTVGDDPTSNPTSVQCHPYCGPDPDVGVDPIGHLVIEQLVDRRHIRADTDHPARGSAGDLRYFCFDNRYRFGSVGRAEVEG